LLIFGGGDGRWRADNGGAVQMKLCVCERRLQQGSAPGTGRAVEEDLGAAPLGVESAWEAVEE
jgi:hypothetical protein